MDNWELTRISESSNDDWPDLNKTCDHCYGNGEIAREDDDGSFTFVRCHVCDGIGLVY